MRDIIHIGFPRTATTWFQNNFFPKVKNYTLIPRDIVQQNLIHALPGSLNNGWVKTFKFEDKGIIVSEEMITGRNRAGLTNFFFLEFYLKRIKESFNNPLIILFLRNQQDSIFSMYNLYIKKGGTFSFKNFVAHDTSLKEQLLFSYNYYCYDKTLKILADNLGKENIRIYLYEEFVANPNVFLTNLANEFEFDIDLNNISFEKINQGYSPLKLQIKRVLNRFTKLGLPFKQYFCNISFLYNFLQKGNKNHPKIPQKFRKDIEKHNSEFIKSNRTIMEEYSLHRLKDYNYQV